ncbi:MAG: P1 family peptidase [Limnochordaceae bacterium]|nr:P1 family peptidase [Limnochordaceae bacterium]
MGNGRPRAREWGLRLGVLPPGPRNAITDVEGVAVGHTTLWMGEGPLVEGVGPVRTGVTVILPHRGNLYLEKVPAAQFTFNGYGKATGLAQIDETGTLESPIAVTSTLNVARVADALVSHCLEQNPGVGRVLGTFSPLVAEIYDGFLSDARGRHVREEHVREAIRSASTGPVEEGCVGAGTGAMAFGWKGGVGTSSRVLPASHGGWTVGSLVVTNFAGVLTIQGLPVGPLLGHMPLDLPASEADAQPHEGGSVIVVLATDAPLSPRNLHRLARRGVIGLARTGFFGTHTSGDFVLAFSTAVRIPHAARLPSGQESLVLPGTGEVRNEATSALFLAAAEATEEAVLNALFRATTVVGRDGHRAEALDLEKLRELLGTLVSR